MSRSKILLTIFSGLLVLALSNTLSWAGFEIASEVDSLSKETQFLLRDAVRRKKLAKGTLMEAAVIAERIASSGLPYQSSRMSKLQEAGVFTADEDTVFNVIESIEAAKLRLHKIEDPALRAWGEAKVRKALLYCGGLEALIDYLKTGTALGEEDSLERLALLEPESIRIRRLLPKLAEEGSMTSRQRQYLLIQRLKGGRGVLRQADVEIEFNLFQMDNPVVTARVEGSISDSEQNPELDTAFTELDALQKNRWRRTEKEEEALHPHH